VNHLGVRNFVAYPDLGITAESVDAVLTNALKELEDASRPGPSGFTAAETRRDRHVAQVDGVSQGLKLSDRDAAQLSALLATPEVAVEVRRSWSWSRSRHG
jgi:hypothetical protein